MNIYEKIITSIKIFEKEWNETEDTFFNSFNILHYNKFWAQSLGNTFSRFCQQMEGK